MIHNLLKRKKKINGKIFLIMILVEFLVLSLMTLFMMYFDYKILTVTVTLVCLITVLMINVEKNKGKLDLSSPAFLYSLFYFAFFGLGLLFLDTSGDPSFNLKIVYKSIIIGAFAIIISSFFEKKYKHESMQIVITDKNLNKSNFFAKILYLIGLFGFCLNILKVGTLPIFLSDLEQSRVEASLTISGYVRILVYFFIPAGIISFNNYIESKKKKKSVISNLIMWASSIVFLLSLGNRSPAFTIILISILTYIFTNNISKLSIRKIVKIGIPSIIVVIAFVGGIGAFRVINTPAMWNYVEYKPLLEQKNYFGLVMFSFFHYFSIGVNNFIDMLKVVPSYLPFQFGKTYFSPILTILPGTQYTLDIQIKNALGQTYLGGGTIPSFLGEAYVNFGYFGTFFIPMFSLFLIERLRRMFLTKKSMGSRVIYIYIFFYLCYSQLAGIASTSIFPVIAIMIFVIYYYYLGED